MASRTTLSALYAQPTIAAPADRAMHRMSIDNPKQLTLLLGNQTVEECQKDRYAQFAGVEHKADGSLIAEAGNEVNSHSFLLAQMNFRRFSDWVVFQRCCWIN